MVVTKITVFKRYLRECVKIFLKHRIKISVFIISVLTLASLIYMFGEFCYTSCTELIYFPFSLMKCFILSYTYEKDEIALANLRKRQMKMDLVTQALQRRVKELTVRSGFGGEYITDTQAKNMIEEALRIYNSDKLGIRDYALESAGANIISTPKTRSVGLPKIYTLIHYIGIKTYSNPRQIIQPDVLPGKCFTFEGFQGRIRIQLATEIYIRSVTLENCPTNLLTFDEILQIPTSFQVIGLRTEDSNDGIILGEFKYNVEGAPAQNFIIKDYKNHPSFAYVELYIMGNNGHTKQTSVYRFRVHGNEWGQ